MESLAQRLNSTRPEGSLAERLEAARPDEPSYLGDMARGVVSGIAEGLQNISDAFVFDTPAHERIRAVEQVLIDKGYSKGDGYGDELAYDPQTVPGQLSKGISQFATGFAVTRRFMPGSIDTITKGLSAGAITDYLVWGPDDPRLADLIADNTDFQSSVIDYLKHDDNDTEIENRFKNMLEGMGLGLAMEGIIYGVKSLKGSVAPEELTKKLDEAPDETMEELAERIVQEAPSKAPERSKPSEGAMFNTEKMETDEDTIRVINTIMEGSEEDVKRLITNGTKSKEEIERNAAEYLKDKSTEQLATEAKQLFDGMKDADERLVAYISAMVDRTQQLTKTAKEALDSGDPYKELQAAQELAEVMTLLRPAKGIQTAAARTTFSGNIAKGSSILSKLDHLRELAPAVAEKELDQMMNVLKRKDLRKALEKLTADQDIPKMHEEMKKLNGSPLINAMLEVRSAGMLSGPPTFARNFAGNGMSVIMDHTEHLVAGLMGTVRGGQDRVVLQEVGQRAAKSITRSWEALKYVGSYVGREVADAKSVKGFEDSLEKQYLDNYEKFDTSTYQKFSSESLKESKALNTALSLSHIKDTKVENYLWSTVDTVGSIIRVPYMALGVTDDFFKRTIYGSEVDYIAMREARLKGLKGPERDQFINDFTKAHRMLFVKNQSLSDQDKAFIGKYIDKGRFHVEAIGKARELTFTEELTTGSSINNLITKIDQARTANPIGQYLLPFFRTPVNLSKWVGRRTPGLHLLSTKMMDDLKAGGARADLARAKLFLGTSLYSVGMYLYFSGRLKGVSEKDEYQIDTDTGIREVSVKMGDTWVNINGLDPIGMTLGVAASLGKTIAQLNEEGKELPDQVLEAISGIIGAYSENILSKTYTQSLSDFLKALDDEDYRESYGRRSAVTFSPYMSLGKYVSGKFDDQYLKEAMTLTEELERIYLPSKARKKLDSLGEYIERPDQFLDFVQYKDVKDLSPLEKELVKLRINVSKVPKRLSYKGHVVDLEPEEYWKLRRTTHKLKLKDALERLVSSKGYREAPKGLYYASKGTQRRLIQDLIGDYRSKAKEMFIAQNKDVLDRLVEQKVADYKSLDLTKKEEDIISKWVD